MEAQYIETLVYSYIILISLIGLWMLLGLIGRLILTKRAEIVNEKSALWYLAWLPLIGWFFTARSVNKSLIWSSLILISSLLGSYGMLGNFSTFSLIFNSALGGQPPITATHIANPPTYFLGWLLYALALIAEFVILRGLAKTLDFSLLRTVLIFILGGPFWLMKNRLKNQTSNQEKTEKIEYL